MRRDLTTTHRPGRAVIRINNSKKSARRFLAQRRAVRGLSDMISAAWLVSVGDAVSDRHRLRDFVIASAARMYRRE